MSHHLSRALVIAFAGLVPSITAPGVYGADFKAIAIGQVLANEALEIGRFSIRLPHGEWTVVAKQQVSAGYQAGRALAAPEQQTVAVVRLAAGTLEALIFIRTPAATFLVDKWSDDPCAAIADAFVKDTLKGRMFMPECFAVVPYASSAITNAKTGAAKEASTWFAANKVLIPEWLFRVYNAKYYGGDFLHMNSYFPAQASPSHKPAAAPAGLEEWGRSAALAIQQLVSRETTLATLPPLPQIQAPK